MYKSRQVSSKLRELLRNRKDLRQCSDALREYVVSLEEAVKLPTIFCQEISTPRLPGFVRLSELRQQVLHFDNVVYPRVLVKAIWQPTPGVGGQLVWTVAESLRTVYPEYKDAVKYTSKSIQHTSGWVETVPVTWIRNDLARIIVGLAKNEGCLHGTLFRL